MKYSRFSVDGRKYMHTSVWPARHSMCARDQERQCYPSQNRLVGSQYSEFTKATTETRGVKISRRDYRSLRCCCCCSVAILPSRGERGSGGSAPTGLAVLERKVVYISFISPRDGTTVVVVAGGVRGAKKGVRLAGWKLLLTQRIKLKTINAPVTVERTIRSRPPSPLPPRTLAPDTIKRP